jgi:hypothetical protein
MKCTGGQIPPVTMRGQVPEKVARHAADYAMSRVVLEDICPSTGPDCDHDPPFLETRWTRTFVAHACLGAQPVQPGAGRPRLRTQRRRRRGARQRCRSWLARVPSGAPQTAHGAGRVGATKDHRTSPPTARLLGVMARVRCRPSAAGSVGCGCARRRGDRRVAPHFCAGRGRAPGPIWPVCRRAARACPYSCRWARA